MIDRDNMLAFLGGIILFFYAKGIYIFVTSIALTFAFIQFIYNKFLEKKLDAKMVEERSKRYSKNKKKNFIILNFLVTPTLLVVSIMFEFCTFKLELVLLGVCFGFMLSIAIFISEYFLD